MAYEHASPWKLGGLTVGQLAKRVWAGINDDDVFGRAAQLAYAFVFALFPFLIFLLSVLGMVTAPGSHLRTSLISGLTNAMPPQASQLVQQVIQETSQASSGAKLWFGLIVSLVSATSGMTAMMDTLNAAYEVREGRSFLRLRGTALGLTVAIGVLVVVAVTILLYGGTVAEHVGGIIGLSDAATMAWKIVQWPLALFFLLVSFALIYYYGPDVETPAWHWITPGSLVGVALFLAVSFALRLYLHYFNSYSKTYGSLGAMMILLLWFYVSGASFMIGGEVNAEIENAAAKRGVPEAKEKGQKTPTSPPQRAA